MMARWVQCDTVKAARVLSGRRSHGSPIIEKSLFNVGGSIGDGFTRYIVVERSLYLNFIYVLLGKLSLDNGHVSLYLSCQMLRNSATEVLHPKALP